MAKRSKSKKRPEHSRWYPQTGPALDPRRYTFFCRTRPKKPENGSRRRWRGLARRSGFWYTVRAASSQN